MAKNELKDLYDKIAEPGTKCEYFSDSIDFGKIISQFKDVEEEQDSPDGIILVEDTAYMVEHFQISLYFKKKRNKKGWNDDLKEALNTQNPQGTKNAIALYDECEDWENQLLNNWLAAFSDLLDDHLSHYSTYEERTQKEYPDKPREFILTVEDNSNSIISNDSLCILGIQDFVEKILSYNEISGVIVFHTSTRGNVVIAKDRSHLELDRSSRKLCPLSSCDICASTKEVMIGDLTPEQRADLMEKICRILFKTDENMALKECAHVIIHEHQ